MSRDPKVGLMSLVFFISINLACAAHPEDILKDQACKVTFSSFKGLPTQVLVGTDVVDVSSFKETSQQLKQNYVAEMGGALLSIHITQTDHVGILKRTYQEPGMPEAVREFSPVCIDKERLSAGALKGKLVEGGLLILEEQSDVEGIPNNLWTFYKSN